MLSTDLTSKPYLIQRIGIKSRVVEVKGKRKRKHMPKLPPTDQCKVLADWIDIDYMGSSEFEYGAWHKSIRAMHADKFLCINTFDVLGKKVYVIGNPDKAKEYAYRWLYELANDKIGLKEPIGFGQVYPGGWSDYRKEKVKSGHEVIWHDILNHVAFSFNPEYARLFMVTGAATIAAWDAKNAARAG